MTSEEYTEKEAEILRSIPQEFHSCLIHFAYSYSKTDALEDKLTELSRIVYHLEFPFQRFEDRIVHTDNSNKKASCGKYYSKDNPFCKTVNGIPYYYYGAGHWEEMK